MGDMTVDILVKAMVNIMLTKLQRKHYPLCGIKDQPYMWTAAR